jgi:tetratricopeptide (TPR) repeat protein
MSIFDKLFELKLKGQQFKSKGETKEAIKEFSKLIIMINHVFKSEGLDKETEFKLVKDLQIPTFLKLSSCYLHLNEDLNKVIMFCTNVLEIDESNSKAYYFRSKAFFSNGEYDRALKDLNFARENDPNKHKYRDFQSKVRKMKSADPSRHHLSIWISIGKQLMLSCKRRRQVM